MNTNLPAQLACGFACLLATGSALWFGPAQPPLQETRPDEAGPAGVRKSLPISLPDVAAIWPEPSPLPREGRWVYEIFTPPAIRYIESTGRFVVDASEVRAEAAAVPADEFGLELERVEPEWFRLQLVGYVGGGDHWAGTFLDLKTGETHLARSGDEFPAAGLRLESFEVRRQTVPIRDSMESLERVATAVVLDPGSGERTVLTDRARVATGGVRAIFRLAGRQSGRREATEGEVIEAGSHRFVVAEIRSAPPSAAVGKFSADGAPVEHRTLNPSATLAPTTPNPVPPP